MRLIDADALIEALNKAEVPYRADVQFAIDNAPTIDTVPVVRCKDCRWKADTIGESWCDFHFYEFTILSDDDFCSNGERKDNEDR